MKKLSLFFCLFLCTQSTQSETIKVKKIKGNQAVIEFTGNLITEGSYQISPQNKPSSLSRDHVIGFSGSFYNLQKDTSGFTTSRSYFGVNANYGWNTGGFEYGPRFAYTSSDTGSGATTTYALGGFLDWNLQENKIDNNTIFGFGFNALYGASNAPSGSSTNQLNFYPSFFVKWFPLIPAVALRLDSGYRYVSETASGSTSTTTGFELNAGFSIYY